MDIQTDGINPTYFSYTDRDGVGFDGTPGTFRLDEPCLVTSASPGSCPVNTTNITGITLNIDGSVNINGTIRPGIRLSFGENPSNLDFTVSQIHLGATGNPLARDLLINNINWYNSYLELGAAKSNEGFLGDLNLRLRIDSLELQDDDGYGGSAWARFAIRDLVIDDGSGGPVNLEGFRLDVGQGVTVNGLTQGAIVFEAPSGPMTIQTGSITYDDGFGSNYVSGTRFTDVNFAGTSLEVAAK